MGALFVCSLLLGCARPKFPNCEKDEHCSADGGSGICLNGTCVACRDDAGCGVGSECKAGACAPIADYCDGAHACGAGKSCGVDKRCREEAFAGKTRSTECDDSRPCQQGQSCQNGHCVSPPQGGPGCQDFSAPKFDFESPTLRPDARATLERLAGCLTTGGLKSASVLVTGHCDPRGESEFNLGLGAQRAETVRTTLITLGVPPSRVATSSRGELDARGTEEATWETDRRVDIEVR